MNCHYCGVDLEMSPQRALQRNSYTKDHLVSRSRGGSAQLHNLVAACRKCNSSKGDKSPEEYRRYLMRKRSALGALHLDLAKHASDERLSPEDRAILVKARESLSPCPQVVFAGEAL